MLVFCFVLCPPALRTAMKCSLRTRTGRIGTARHCVSMSAGDSEADDDDDNEDEDEDEEEDKEEENDEAAVGDSDDEAAAAIGTTFAAAAAEAASVSVARSAVFSRTNCACDSLSAARLASLRAGQGVCVCHMAAKNNSACKAKQIKS
jgi:hypothetical protein